MKITKYTQSCILIETKGKRILITGGGSGIGFAIAKKCLFEGAEVVITGRNLEKLETAQAELGNTSLHILQWDVSDVALVQEKMSEAYSLLNGRMDILVNNAGVLSSDNFCSVSVDEWERVYAVNSKGMFFLTQAITNSWIESKIGGKILNISSTAGFRAAPDPYCLSKWDTVGLTSGLGRTLYPHGIIVNGIAPGRTATAMLGKKSTENIYDPCTSAKRFAMPEEIAELAIFMISDASNFIVGQTIICDGGYTLKA